MQGYSVKLKKLNKNQGFSATNLKSHLEIYLMKIRKKKQKRFNSCSACLNPKSPRELYSEEKNKKKSKLKAFSTPNLKSHLEIYSVNQKKKKKRLNSFSAVLSPKSPRELCSEEKHKKKNFSAPNLKSNLQVCLVVRLKNQLEVYLVTVLSLNNLQGFSAAINLSSHSQSDFLAPRNLKRILLLIYSTANHKSHLPLYSVVELKSLQAFLVLDPSHQQDSSVKQLQKNQHQMYKNNSFKKQ